MKQKAVAGSLGCFMTEALKRVGSGLFCKI